MQLLFETFRSYIFSFEFAVLSYEVRGIETRLIASVQCTLLNAPCPFNDNSFSAAQQYRPN